MLNIVRCFDFQAKKLSFPVSHPSPVADGLCFLRYLINQHATGHGESGLGGKVAGDHDSKASLRERQLVWVGRQQLIHHDHRCFAVEIG